MGLPAAWPRRGCPDALSEDATAGDGGGRAGRGGRIPSCCSRGEREAPRGALTRGPERTPESVSAEELAGWDPAGGRAGTGPGTQETFSRLAQRNGLFLGARRVG